MQPADGEERLGPNGTAEEGPEGAETSLETLRRMLVGREIASLDRIERHLAEQRVEAGDVGSVLPEAVRRLTAQDDRLARALAPTIEEALQSSVRRNPKPLTDAIFPIIGPAIRKSIQTALAAAMDGFNRVLERSLSPRSFQWRLQAWRTGKPFAEIVLLNSLTYRVEQLFLIHHGTSLVLRHVASPSATVQDADMVSAMLSAIQDFVRDSFGAAERGELSQIEVSGFSVEIVQGPGAVLAAVVRGVPPSGYRDRLQATLEDVHLEMAEDLATFAGDSSAFEAVDTLLHERLEEQRRPRPARRRSRWWLLGPALLLLGALVLHFALGEVEQRRAWTRALASLEAEPGLVVVSAERAGGRFSIQGLRDELAREPLALLAEAGIDPGRVDARWSAYQSLDPGIALTRALEVLDPPASVELRLEGQQLVARGSASEEWVRSTEARVAGLAGVRGLDSSELENVDARRLRDAADALARHPLRFPTGSAQLPEGPDLEGWLARVAEVHAAATRCGRIVRIELQGDLAPDEREHGPALALARAELARSALASHPATSAASTGLRDPESGSEATGMPRVRAHVVSLGRFVPLEEGE